MKKRIEEIHLTLLEAHRAFPGEPLVKKWIYRAMLEAEDLLCDDRNAEFADLRYFIRKAFQQMEGQAYPTISKKKMSRAMRLVNFKPVKDFDSETAQDFLEEFSDEV